MAAETLYADAFVSGGWSSTGSALGAPAGGSGAQSTVVGTVGTWSLANIAGAAGHDATSVTYGVRACFPSGTTAQAMVLLVELVDPAGTVIHSFTTAALPKDSTYRDYTATTAVAHTRTNTDGYRVRVTHQVSGGGMSGTSQIWIDAMWAAVTFTAHVVSIPIKWFPRIIPTGRAFLWKVQISGTATGWTITSGSLPPGLSLNATTGEITGTPTTPGDYTFTLQCADATSSDSVTATVEVRALADCDDVQVSRYRGTGATVRVYSAGVDLSGGGVVLLHKLDSNFSTLAAWCLLSDGTNNCYRQFTQSTASPFGDTVLDAATFANGYVDVPAALAEEGFDYVATVMKRRAGICDVMRYTGTSGSQSVPHAVGYTPAVAWVFPETAANATGGRHAGSAVWSPSDGRNTSSASVSSMGSSSIGVTATLSVSAMPYWAFVVANNPDVFTAGTVTGNGSSSGPSLLTDDRLARCFIYGGSSLTASNGNRIWHRDLQAGYVFDYDFGAGTPKARYLSSGTGTSIATAYRAIEDSTFGGTQHLAVASSDQFINQNGIIYSYLVALEEPPAGVVGGDQALAPDSVSSVPVIGSPSLGAQATVTPDSTTGSSAIGDPVLTPSASLAPTSLVGTSAVGAPLVANGDSPVFEPTSLASPAAIGGISGVTGAASIAPGSTTASSVVPAPSLSAAAAIALAALASPAAISAPALSASASLALGAVVGGGAIGSVTLSVLTSVELASVASPAAVAAPALSAAHSLQPASLASPAAIAAPAMATVSGLTPTSLASPAALGEPALSAAATVQLTALASPASVASPTLSAQGGLAPTSVTSPAAVGVPAIVPGTTALSTASLGSPAAIGTPALASTALILPFPVVSAPAIGAPALLPGGVALAPSSVLALSSIGGLFRLSGGARLPPVLGAPRPDNSSIDSARPGGPTEAEREQHAFIAAAAPAASTAEGERGGDADLQAERPAHDATVAAR